MEHLDGNAAAAALEQAFGRDMTATTARCGSCGFAAALARAHVYARGPGTVLRCEACGGVLARMAWTGRLVVDTAGIAQLG